MMLPLASFLIALDRDLPKPHAGTGIDLESHPRRIGRVVGNERGSEDLRVVVAGLVHATGQCVTRRLKLPG